MNQENNQNYGPTPIPQPRDHEITAFLRAWIALNEPSRETAALAISEDQRFTRPAITDVEKAAHRLADAAAELVALIVEGVLVWIVSKSASAKSGKLAKAGGNLSDPAVLAARGREIMQELKAKPAEMQAALAAGTAELSSVFRKAGSLTRGLADFIEKKFNQILENVTEDAGKKAAAKSRGGGVMGDDAAADATSPNRPSSGKAARLPQDVNVNPKAPPAMGLTRPIGTSARQASELGSDIQAAQAQGATDIRVNQQQIDASGTRVGTIGLTCNTPMQMDNGSISSTKYFL